jgi:hypothetical protein
MSEVTVLKTGRLYEADMLADALTSAGIPYFRREENFAGLQLAMPAMPSPGPGTFFCVIVPEAAAPDAREVLAELPIDPEDPGLWSFSPTTTGRKLFTVYGIISLVVIVLCGIVGFLERLYT